MFQQTSALDVFQLKKNNIDCIFFSTQCHSYFFSSRSFIFFCFLCYSFHWKFQDSNRQTDLCFRFFFSISLLTYSFSLSFFRFPAPHCFFSQFLFLRDPDHLPFTNKNLRGWEEGTDNEDSAQPILTSLLFFLVLFSSLFKEKSHKADFPHHGL